MAITLIARLQNLEQYKKDEQKIYWQDTTVTRWQNVYSKLEIGYKCIYLSDGRVLIGEIEDIISDVSIVIKNVKEFQVGNDDFLRLSELSPENISTVKANFHPFINYTEIDFDQLEKDLTAKTFVSFYIVRENDVKNLLPSLLQNDRVIIVNANKKITWIHQFFDGRLTDLDNFKSDLFGAKDYAIDEIKEMHVKSEKKNNIAAVERMIAGLEKDGFFKFKTFTEYYNLIHNKRLYQNIYDENEIDVAEQKNTIKMNLNTILYGPAGTGKTYTTIEKSIQIANPEFDIVNCSRAELRAEYNRLIKDGQIEFITFHQSLSYEDFIEGIKPMEPKQEDTFLKYEITDGIFKRLAERAAKVPDTKSTGFSINDNDFNKASFYKISLGDTSNSDDDQIYEWCIKNGYIGLGWGDAIDFTGKTEHDIQLMVPSLLDKFGGQAVNYFIHFLKEGDYVIVSYGNRSFRAIGKVTGNYEFKNVDGLYVHQFRKVEWLLTNVELPCEEVYNKQFSQQSIYRLDKREIKKDFFVNTKTISIIEDKPKNYVLIIDEINRGNVSQIFGELITLIEEDKRTGNKEALSVILPYSKKSFSVPANLYLIGTMNTADRSVEALDTALRRRFVFEEMLSDETLLSPFKLLQRLWLKYWGVKKGDEKYDEWDRDHNSFMELAGIEESDNYYDIMGDIEDEETEAEWLNKNPKEVFKNIIDINGNGIDLEKLLLAINIRLKTLLTKDHSIGHAWLMEIYSLAELQLAFKNKIIPLLQEFFYNDYAKIGLVLGDAFVQQIAAGSKIFAKFNDSTEIASDYENKFVYTLINPLEIDMEGYKSIYK